MSTARHRVDLDVWFEPGSRRPLVGVDGNGDATRLALELFKGETEGYRVNLSQPVPMVYVALRPSEGALRPGEGGPRPCKITACPYEAGNYDVGGDDWVEAVPMPEAVAAVVAAFVAAHHVEEPFRKRKRGPREAQAPKRKGRVIGPRYG